MVAAGTTFNVCGMTRPGIEPQPSFDNCQKSGTDEKPVMVGNSIRICPYLIGIKTVYIP